MDFNITNLMRQSMRNIAATVATGSDFEKKLFKATYHMDMQEPKEKHVSFIIECFADQHKAIVGQDQALKIFIERHKNKQGDFVTNTKCFTILHRCLSNKHICQLISQFIKLDENGNRFLKSFDQSLNSQIPITQNMGHSNQKYQNAFQEIFSAQYSQYIKTWAKTHTDMPLVTQSILDADQACKRLKSSELYATLDSINVLMTQIKGIMQSLGIETPSSKKSSQMQSALSKQSFGHSENLANLQQYFLIHRLFVNMIQLLFQDLLNHYQMAFVIICEIIQKTLDQMSQKDGSNIKQTYHAYKTFVDESFDIKNLSQEIIDKMKFTISCPAIFYTQKRTLDSDLAGALENKDTEKIQEILGQIIQDLDRDQIHNVSRAQQMLDLRILKQKSSETRSKSKSKSKASNPFDNSDSDSDFEDKQRKSKYKVSGDSGDPTKSKDVTDQNFPSKPNDDVQRSQTNPTAKRISVNDPAQALSSNELKFGQNPKSKTEAVPKLDKHIQDEDFFNFDNIATQEEQKKTKESPEKVAQNDFFSLDFGQDQKKQSAPSQKQQDLFDFSDISNPAQKTSDNSASVDPFAAFNDPLLDGSFIQEQKSFKPMPFQTAAGPQINQGVGHNNIRGPNQLPNQNVVYQTNQNQTMINPNININISMQQQPNFGNGQMPMGMPQQQMGQPMGMQGMPQQPMGMPQMPNMGYGMQQYGTQQQPMTPAQLKQMHQYKIEQEMWNMNLNK